MSREAADSLVSSARAAALRLHHFLDERYWDGHTLGGPDQGVRWHIRFGRFAKSYFPFLQGRERHVFRQGQGYWALANEALAAATGETAYRERLLAVAGECLASQLPDGSWEYPLRARRHLRATVEGDFAALALLRAYRASGDARLRDGALKWHEFVESRIGFEPGPRGGLAVHYFDRPRGLVPNNSAEFIWILGEFAAATGDPKFLARVPALLTFLETVQYPSGEFPYELPSPHDSRHQPHYLCYQYNAFQAMKLWWYFDWSGDPRAGELAARCTAFLCGGVRENGAVRSGCGQDLPEVLYYADAVAMALLLGARRGVPEAHALSRRAMTWVLSRQLPSGGFHFSRGDYRVLADRRFYPRNLAMTLFHLLEWSRLEGEGGA